MLKDAPVTPYIPVSDLARARKFYEEKIGLARGQEVMGGFRFECGNGTWFFMYQSKFAGSNKASQLFFTVKDVEAEVAALKGRGVTFERYDLPGMTWKGDVGIAGDSKAAWFKDPEGNIVAIQQG